MNQIQLHQKMDGLEGKDLEVFMDDVLFKTLRVKIKVNKNLYKNELQTKYTVVGMKNVEDACVYYTKILLD